MCTPNGMYYAKNIPILNSIVNKRYSDIYKACVWDILGQLFPYEVSLTEVSALVFNSMLWEKSQICYGLVAFHLQVIEVKNTNQKSLQIIFRSFCFCRVPVVRESFG